MMKEIVIIGIMGLNQNPNYFICEKDGVETITFHLDELKLEYEIGVKILPNGRLMKDIPELKQGMKKIKNTNLEALIPKDMNYVPEPFEKEDNKKYFEKNNFYSNPILKKPEFYRRTNNRFHKHKQGITGTLDEIRKSKNIQMNYKNYKSFELVYLKKEKLKIK